MTDIMQSWKDQRFVVTPQELLDAGEFLVILTDITFWNDHYEELKDWCDENCCHQQGMTVVADNEQALTAFCLRWS